MPSKEYKTGSTDQPISENEQASVPLQTDLAYAAGLWDCCGTMFLVKGTKNAPYLHVQIQLKNLDVLCHIEKAFGGSVNERKNGVHYWKAYGKRGQEFLTSLLPFIQIKRRRETIELAAQYPFLKKGKRLTRIAGQERIKTILALEKEIAKKNSKKAKGLRFNKRHKKVPGENEYAYLAAVVDSKASILGKEPTWRGPVLRVTSTDPELIRFLWNYFEGSTHLLKKQKHGAPQVYVWTCAITQTRRLTEKIKPYMHNEEKIELLDYWLVAKMPPKVKPKKPSDELLPSKWAKMFT